MQKSISRRKFLKTATVTGGAALLAAGGADAAPAKKGAGTASPQPCCPTRAEVAEAFARLDDYGSVTRQSVFKTQIAPHWFDGSARFWYRNDLTGGTREFVRVDAARGVREPAFDHAKLAAALSKSAGETHAADRLPFDAIAYDDGLSAVTFTVGETVWQCDLTTYACVKLPDRAPQAADKPPAPDETSPAATGDASPDGQWTVAVRDHNLFVRAQNGTETALTTDGTTECPYGEPAWGPDSKTLVAYRITPIKIKDCYLVESSPKDGGTRGVLHAHEYAQPGDPFPMYQMWLFNVTGTATQAQTETMDGWRGTPDLHWRDDGHSFLFENPDRGHQFFQIVEVSAPTGKTRVVVDERTKTFINTSNTNPYYTKDAAEVIFPSERSGWRHLYLYDAHTGTLQNPITQGEWVVRGIDRVDEDARQIWFQGSGRNPGEDPYHIHHYRVNFDGTGLVALTDGDGSHSVQYSPDRAYLIDTYSRADLPPVHTLRRTADGAHLCDLERADASALLAHGWRMPEVFHAPGRDGQTAIWGLVFRPTHFNPSLKYPVIENIYAGPQDSFVRKIFAVQDGMQTLAELGFVVVQCDGMGTRNRSKAFHDVCWRNLKDAGFPDRIAWMTALAKKHPQCDIGRVGIYGTSAGGQNSTGALLFHPEFYKVAVSSCGCHDNRIDKQWWNEQWMGYPPGTWYADNSNITHAARLRGRLLLLVGELDTNVPPESTVRLTDALMGADKDFELVVITGSDHTGGGPYGERRRRDFFVRHLLGVEPPDRNAPRPPVRPIQLTPRPLGEASLAQPNGGADTTILFQNRTADTVELFWLAGDGSRKSYGTVAPGGDYLQHTYEGHSWLVVGADGKPLALFVGESRPGIAEIR